MNPLEDFKNYLYERRKRYLSETIDTLISMHNTFPEVSLPFIRDDLVTYAEHYWRHTGQRYVTDKLDLRRLNDTRRSES